ncbi:MAG TPA: CDP-alcohol phosphatidyltransferase family protein [Acidimicrobiales bacterium]|nr:CDP-alcohol phosphatidyltransferase family protein [Acidimicrobiales bacterium]
MSTDFGPSALITPANAITLGRLLATPLLLALVLADPVSWFTLVVWILLAATDGVDGYLARRQGTTRSGAFLDPLADKFLVLGAMVALVMRSILWWVPVAILFGREASISVFRSAMAKRGVSIPARSTAKAKTVVQSVAVGFAMFPVTDSHPGIAGGVLWLSVVLALVSGAQYLIDARRAHAV